MTNTGIIVQARTGSTRFPNKVILPFYFEASIIDIILEKLKEITINVPVVLATTDSVADRILVEKARQHGVDFYQGSEDDVLQRFIEAGERFKIENIIRICADNPFIDISSIEYLIRAFSSSKSDYLAFHINGIPSIRSHYGLWAEAVRLSALKKVNTLTKDNIYHEHVTNYIYSNPHLFDIKLIDAPIQLSKHNIRLTIDTKEDFNLMKNIYRLVVSDRTISTDFLLKVISENLDWLEIMQEQIEKNSK